MTKASEINAVVTDGELERGEHPIGKLVHISTVTHAWRGVLKEVTSSYFILDGNETIALVDSTGAMGNYLADPTEVREGDSFKPGKGKKPSIMIPRGAVAWMIAWA